MDTGVADLCGLLAECNHWKKDKSGSFGLYLVQKCPAQVPPARASLCFFLIPVHDKLHTLVQQRGILSKRESRGWYSSKLGRVNHKEVKGWLT